MSQAVNPESTVPDAADNQGPGDAPQRPASEALIDIGQRVLAAKVMLDTLLQGLRQIGASAGAGAIAGPSAGVGDRQDLLALVGDEAERARALLSGILADLPSLAPEHLVLDGSLQRLMALAGPALARDLIDQLSTDLAGVAAALLAAGARGDRAGLQAQSHILIALAGAAGARRLQAVAEHLHQIPAGADLATLHQILPGCLALITALREKVCSLPMPDEIGAA